MLNKKQKKYIVIMLVCAFLISTTVFFVLSKLVTKPVQAAITVYTWDSGGDGTNWTDALNWDQDSSYPRNQNNKAVINTTNDNITTAGALITGLGDLDIGAGYSGVLTTEVAGGLSIYAGGDGDGSFTLSGGTLRPSSDINVYGTATINGGTFDFATNDILLKARYMVINGGTINKGSSSLEIVGAEFSLGCSTGSYTDNTGLANFGLVTISTNATLASNIVADDLKLNGCVLTTGGYDIDSNGYIAGELEAFGVNATAGVGGDSTIRVAGAFTPGDFTAGSSTVIFDGSSEQIVSSMGVLNFNNATVENTSVGGVKFNPSISPTTFARLTDNTPGSRIVFQDTVGTHTITNQLVLNGDPGNEVEIRSNHTDSAFPVDVEEASPTVENVDVQDSNASSGNNITAVNSINSGNNSNWTFVNDPDTPINLTQKDGSGNTIAAGGTTTSTSIQFGATLADDNADQVQLCVETQPVGTAFTNTEASCGSLVASGATGSVTLNSQTAGSYHWQARAKDAGGRTSSWVSFGNTTDYIIAGVAPPTTTTTTATKTATSSSTTGTDTGTTTTATTSAPLCGNSVLDAGEECDSGVDLGTCPKTCSSRCVINDCGIVVELPVPPEDPGDTIVIINPPSTIGPGDDLTLIIKVPKKDVTVIDVIIDNKDVTRTQVKNLEFLVDEGDTNIYRYTDRQNFSAGKHTLRIRGFDVKGKPLYTSKPITFQVVKNAIYFAGILIPLWLVALIGMFLPPLGMLMQYLPYAHNAYEQINLAFQLRSFRAAYPIFWSVVQTTVLIFFLFFFVWRRKKRKKRK